MRLQKIKHNTVLLAGQTDSPGPKVTSLAVPVSLLSRRFLGVSKSTVFPKNCATFKLLLWDNVFPLPVKGLTDYLTVLDLHSFVMEGLW